MRVGGGINAKRTVDAETCDLASKYRDKCSEARQASAVRQQHDYLTFKT